MTEKNIKCIVFIESLEQSSYCCGLYDHTTIIEPMEHRTVDAIRLLQTKASSTLIVLPGTWVSIHTITLPKIKQKKIKEALLFSLEDQYAQSIDSLHVIFTKSSTTPGEYTVFAIDQRKMQALLDRLNTMEIIFDTITCDWFATHPQELLVGSNHLLIHQHTFKGSLSAPLGMLYLQQSEKNYTGYLFNNSAAFIEDPACTSLNDTFESFIAIRLLNINNLNFCQGIFQQKKPKHSRYSLHSVFLASAAGLLTLLIFNILHWFALTSELHQLQNNNRTLAQSFFPNQSIKGPDFKTEIQQRLTHHQPTHLLFFALLKEISEILYQHQGIHVMQLDYQDQKIKLHLKMKDLSLLNAFQNALKHKQLQVQQSQTKASAHNVETTLEIFK